MPPTWLPQVQLPTRKKKEKRKEEWPFNLPLDLNQIVDKKLTVYLKKSRLLQPLHKKKSISFNPEKQVASIRIQKTWRGYAIRKDLWSSTGFMATHYATTLQRLFRGHVGRQRALRFRNLKQYASQRKISKWYRRLQTREESILKLVRDVVNFGVVALQARARGNQGRLRYNVLYLAYQEAMITKLQCLFRKLQGRKLVARIRYEKSKRVTHLRRIGTLHRYIARCGRCSSLTCSVDSLLDCIMARHLCLHDFPNAITLCKDGMRLYPTHPVFFFAFAILLLVTSCDSSLDLPMALLLKAKTLSQQKNDFEWQEKLEDNYYRYALVLWEDDPALLLDMAVFQQCVGNITRAQGLYHRLILIRPSMYDVPGYDHRRNMAARIVSNYKIFLSIFKRSFQKMDVARKVAIPPLSSTKCTLNVFSYSNHIRVDIVQANKTACTLYLEDHDISLYLKQLSRGFYTYKPESSTLPLPRRAAGELDLAIQTQWIKAHYSPLHLHDPAIITRAFDTNTPFVFPHRMLPHLLNSLIQTSPNTFVIPFISKLRHRRSVLFQQRDAAIQLQRLVRGTIARNKVLRNFRNEHSKNMQHLKLSSRREMLDVLRKVRYIATCRIQARVRGNQDRDYIRDLQEAALMLQCWSRSFLARRMLQRRRDERNSPQIHQEMYHAGAVVSGHRVLLQILRIGFSWIFTAKDLKECSIYTGCIPMERYRSLVHHATLLQATSLIGKSLHHPVTGALGTVTAMGTSSHTSTLLECTFHPPMGRQTLSLHNVQQGIHSVDPSIEIGTTYRVDELQENMMKVLIPWLRAVPSMNAPSAELKKREGTHVLVVLPPEIQNHPFASSIIPTTFPQSISQTQLYSRDLKHHSALGSTRRVVSSLPSLLTLHRFHALQTNISQKKKSSSSFHRARCSFHYTTYVKCHCTMFLTTTWSHVQSLEFAKISTLNEDTSVTTIADHVIPNASRFTWFLSGSRNVHPGVCDCPNSYCTCVI